MSKRPELNQWTEEKVKSNPYIFGGDVGNPSIIKEYLAETNPKTLVEHLTLEAISESVAVSRIKNQFLEDNPQYDFREKYKPKKKWITNVDNKEVQDES